MRRTSAAALALLLLSSCKTTGGGSGPAPSAAPAPHDLVFTSNSADAVALVRAGVEMLENARHPEARDLAVKALALDPDFASAKALEGLATPGPAGDALIARALDGAEKLPEGERAWIKLAESDHKGDFAGAVERARRLAEVLPEAWRAWLLLGTMQDELARYDEAANALGKAIALEPKAAAAWNVLAYVELSQGKTDKAIEHLKTYASLRPDDPNPCDSLGEALLEAGRFEEAEASYAKAIEHDSSFGPAWQGIAFARLYRGDAAGGIDALAKSAATARAPGERIGVERDRALAEIALGKFEDADRTLDGLEHDAKSAGAELEEKTTPLLRAVAEVDAGKSIAAMATLAEAWGPIDESKLAAPSRASALAMHSRIVGWAGRRVAQNGRGKVASMANELVVHVAVTAAEAAASNAGSPEIVAAAAFTAGERALTEKKPKDGVIAFAKCPATDGLCRLELAAAQEAAGDAKAADATRAALVKTSHRDAWWFYAHTRALPKPH